MLCKTCNTHMISGTSYEKGYSKRYEECPKCRFRKYNKNFNIQELKTTDLDRKHSIKERNNGYKK